MTQPPDSHPTFFDDGDTILGDPTFLDNDINPQTILSTPINPPPPPPNLPEPNGKRRFPLWVILLLVGGGLFLCLVVAGALILPRFFKPDPIQTADLPQVMCTPPPCPEGGTFACGLDSCPGGCGTICILPETTPTFLPATATNTATATAEPASTDVPALPTVTTIPTDIPLSQAGDEQVAEADGMVQLYVPEGEFLMGSNATDPSAQPEEMPAHFVTLDPFWLDKFEVTNAQYTLFLNDRGHSFDCGGEECLDLQAHDPDAHIYVTEDGFVVEDSFEQHPAIDVSWYGAVAYCEWAGRRLPTEAEWEFAARGADGRIYPWGDLFEPAALNYCDQSCDSAYNDTDYNDGFAETAPVGLFPTGASPFGAMDMGGNVWEWVADWYGADFYASSRVVNPLGAEDGIDKVLRGGTYGFVREGNWRTADRGRVPPDFTAPDIGFRCVE